MTIITFQDCVPVHQDYFFYQPSKQETVAQRCFTVGPVYDAGPTVDQRWANVSCLLGRYKTERLSLSRGRYFAN